MKTFPIVLSIAGSDNTGGAGIQADLKTCCAFGVYGATVITGVTAQNSRKVFGVETVSIPMLRDQIDSIFEVMHPDAVKTGMLPSPEIIETVAIKLKEYGVKNIVVDPVMVATNGGSLINSYNETIEAFIKFLLPLATIVTPNMKEASEFLNINAAELDPETACIKLLKLFKSKSVLLKGGHFNSNEAADFLYDSESLNVFSTPRIDTANTHGTGCTLSSAIACGLAKKESLFSAVDNAKKFISKAISSASELKIMEGAGPLDFFV